MINHPKGFDANMFEYSKPFNRLAVDELYNVHITRDVSQSVAVFRNSRVNRSGVLMCDEDICSALKLGNGEGILSVGKSYAH